MTELSNQNYYHLSVSTLREVFKIKRMPTINQVLNIEWFFSVIYLKQQKTNNLLRLNKFVIHFIYNACSSNIFT